jgi:formate dehydrogenase major subunit
MELSRRDFLRLSGPATAGGLLIYKALDLKTASADSSIVVDLHKPIGETTTICCYCGVGCGAIVAADSDNVLNIEGDSDHPINKGTLCPKGQAMAQIRTVNGEDNPRRLTEPLYRAPNSTEWEPKSWDEILEMIAEKVKTTRDQYFITQDSNGKTVNRCEAIAQLGGGELDNEECYLALKMARALGIVFLEHCARL